MGVTKPIDDGDAVVLKNPPGLRRGVTSHQEQGYRGMRRCEIHKLPCDGGIGATFDLDGDGGLLTRESDNSIGVVIRAAPGTACDDRYSGRIAQNAERIGFEASLNLHYWLLIHNVCEYSRFSEYCQPA